MGKRSSVLSFGRFAKRKEERRARKVGDVCETKTKESEAMSKALKTKGFSFVGATTMHALMQSAGMVDDHDAGLFSARVEDCSCERKSEIHVHDVRDGTEKREDCRAETV